MHTIGFKFNLPLPDFDRMRGDFDADLDELLFEYDLRRRCVSSLLLSLSELELDELSLELLSSSELDDDDDESVELELSSSELDDDDDCTAVLCRLFCVVDVEVTSFFRASLSH